MRHERQKRMAYGADWRRRLAAIVLVQAALFASGCSEDDGGPARHNDIEQDSAPALPGRQGKTFVYGCSEEMRFTARIEGEKAWLFLPSGTVSLPQVEAASGAKYSDGSIVFWSKGESAMLDGVAASRLNCENDRYQAIWEDAKLRGADFRGTGNEPGWFLEIGPGNAILLVSDYGSARHEFAPRDVSVEPGASKTTYSAARGETTLKIVLEGKPCTDSMRGDAFETTVRLTLNGRQLNGCGKPLH